MYLISFIQTGLIVQNADTGLYTLGPYAIRLGTRALQRMELMDVASEAMRNLQQQTNSLVLLCAWDARGVITVSRSEGSEPQPLQFNIGGSASLASTATGQSNIDAGQHHNGLVARVSPAEHGLARTPESVPARTDGSRRDR